MVRGDLNRCNVVFEQDTAKKRETLAVTHGLVVKGWSQGQVVGQIVGGMVIPSHGGWAAIIMVRDPYIRQGDTAIS